MLLVALLMAAAAPPAGTITLPAPVVTPALPPGLAATKERQRRSVLPVGGTASDDEVVEVALGPDGTPATVGVDQHLRLTGAGDFVVVERGPARHAVALDDSDLPTLVFGAVLYSGYVPPQGRDLHARLTLDPVLEEPRLPVAVTLRWQRQGSTASSPLAPGGRVPGPGTVIVTLVDTTQVLADVPTGVVPATALAGPLDAVRTAAGGRPPAAGDGLPTTLPASDVRDTGPTTVVVPLRVAGTITGPAGSTLSGPGVTGSTVAGTLSDSVTFRLDVAGAGPVHLDLTARPVLDARTLIPPDGAPTWAAWSDQPRTAAELASATATLMTTAAVSAHLRDVSPYLTTDLVGPTSTTFRLLIAPAVVEAARVTLARPRPGAIALAVLAALLLGADVELLRRRLVNPAGRWAGPAGARRR